jgi:hypothetical protein
MDVVKIPQDLRSGRLSHRPVTEEQTNPIAKNGVF